MINNNPLLNILIIVIPAIIAAVAGYTVKSFEKKKDRNFELAKIKSYMYGEIIESMRAALYAENIDDKTKEEQISRFCSWQKLLNLSDKLWLYGSIKAINAFKEIFHCYKENDLSKYNNALENFIKAVREDILAHFSLKDSNDFKYEFLTYNMDLKKFNESINRIKIFDNK